jgi:hypothetical protein
MADILANDDQVLEFDGQLIISHPMRKGWGATGVLISPARTDSECRDHIMSTRDGPGRGATRPTTTSSCCVITSSGACRATTLSPRPTPLGGGDQNSTATTRMRNVDHV